MKGKRLLVLIGSICLVLVVAALPFMAACAPKEKAAYEIEIYTYKVGTFTYAMGVALADFINADSTWLRATPIEAIGASVTARIVAEEPETRKKIMGFMTRWEAAVAFPPFEKPYDKLRDIAVIGFVSNVFTTLDPNIKTVRDLSGKKVGTGTSPSVARVSAPKLAVEKAGATGVTWSEMGFGDGNRALKDELIDAYLNGAFMVDSVTRKFGPNPALGELVATAKVYWVSFDAAAYTAAIEEIGRKHGKPNTLLYAFTIPADGLPGQTEPCVVQGGPIFWTADTEMPEDVIYEVVRIMAKNAAKFKEYHPLGKSITPENMALLGDESMVHPGALKFYKEQGLKIGSFE